MFIFGFLASRGDVVASIPSRPKRGAVRPSICIFPLYPWHFLSIVLAQSLIPNWDWTFYRGTGRIDDGVERESPFASTECRCAAGTVRKACPPQGKAPSAQGGLIRVLEALDSSHQRAAVVGRPVHGHVVGGRAARGAKCLVLFCTHSQILRRHAFHQGKQCGTRLRAGCGRRTPTVLALREGCMLYFRFRGGWRSWRERAHESSWFRAVPSRTSCCSAANSKPSVSALCWSLTLPATPPWAVGFAGRAPAFMPPWMKYLRTSVRAFRSRVVISLKNQS